MTIFGRIREDHHALREMFERLDDTTERAVKTREELFPQLVAMLLIHAKAEERSLYEALVEAEETRGLVLEGTEEHHVAEVLIAEMAALPVADEQWTAKMEVWREGVLHHLKEEEDELFKKAHRVLSEARAEEVGQAYLAEKKRLAAAPEQGSVPAR